MNAFTEIGKQLILAFKAAKITHALGGFDISINEHLTGDFAPHWRPHAWIFIKSRELTKKAERRLRKHFPADPLLIPKPVMIKRFNRSLTAIAYALKGDFQRRVTLPKNTNRDGSTKKAATSATDLSEPSKIGTDDDARPDWPRKPGVPLWRRGDRSTERLSDLTDTSETIDTA